MNLSGLETPTLIIILVSIFVAVYGTYMMGSHRYAVIHEGFKLSQNPKKPDGKVREELQELHPADIEDAQKERDEIAGRKDKISKLLDEAYEELNKNKYQEDYEEVLGDLDELVDTTILDHIMKNKDVLLTPDLTDAKTMKEIEHITNLDKFKGVLRNMASVVRKD